MRTFKVAIAGTGQTFEARADDTLLGAALRAGIGFPYECSSAGCGSCKFKLASGALQAVSVNQTTLRDSDRRRNKHLACNCRVTSDCVIEVRLDDEYVPKIVPRVVSAEFLAAEELTHNLWEFTFQSDQDAKFLPGQYAKIGIPGVDGHRCYSMSNVSNPAGIWQFQIKKVDGGAASTRLFERSLEGASITIDAPYSAAYLRDSSSAPVLCIAGGSGLAPMFSIARGVAESKRGNRELTLVYGAKQVKDVIDPGRFEQLRRSLPGFKYCPVVSEPETDADYTGATGLVHEYLARSLTLEMSRYEFYIAGPPPMVDAVRRLLVIDRGVRVSNIFYDRFY